MHECIVNALLPPLWDLISTYFHDVELSMMSELAIMPGGKYHKDSKDHKYAKNISMPKELISVYENGVDNKSFPQFKLTSVLTFVYEAALHGCINVIECKYMRGGQWDEHDKGTEWIKHELLALKAGAVISDNVSTLEWVQNCVLADLDAPKIDREWDWGSEFGRWGAEVIHAAVQYRKNDSSKWFRSKTICDAYNFILTAIRHDNFELLQWNWQLPGKKIDSHDTTSMLHYAVKYGSPPMLDWLLTAAGGRSSAEEEITRHWYQQAAYGGKISNLEWLRDKGFTGIYDNNLVAATTVEIAKWLRLHGNLWNQDGHELCSYAERGSIDLLEYAISDGCPWSARVYKVAATYNRLKVLQWGVARKFPLDLTYLINHLIETDVEADLTLNWLKACKCASES